MGKSAQVPEIESEGVLTIYTPDDYELHRFPQSWMHLTFESIKTPNGDDLLVIINEVQRTITTCIRRRLVPGIGSPCFSTWMKNILAGHVIDNLTYRSNEIPADGMTEPMELPKYARNKNLDPLAFEGLLLVLAEKEKFLNLLK